jgi:hypothetical protein
MAEIDRHYHLRAWLSGKGPCLRGWGDHPSRLVDRQTKEVLYRGEPYMLCGRQLRELLALEEDGWDVTIGGRESTHFPGWTVPVVVRDKEAVRRSIEGHFRKMREG